MNIEECIKSDTLTLLLSNAMHRGVESKQRAIAIARTCKIVRDRTRDEVLYRACRAVIKAVSDGRYYAAIEALELTETNYIKEYMQ